MATKVVSVKLEVSFSIEFDDSEQSEKDVRRFALEAAKGAILQEYPELTDIVVTEQEHIGHAFSVTKEDIEDFAEYDISNLSEKEVNDLIDEIDTLMSDNGEMMEGFWDAVTSVCDGHGLNRKKITYENE